MAKMMQRRSQAGFTLTELMVVVSIIGVLVTMAIVYMRPRVRPIDVAMRVGDLVREGSRRAVALGPVRADVAVALGSKARTQVLASQSGSVVTFTLYRLEEAVAPSATGTWMPIESYAVDAAVQTESWASGVGDRASLSLNTGWSTFVSQCRPDGTCDARTVFFQNLSTGLAFERYARISIMPLGGAITTRTDWN